MRARWASYVYYSFCRNKTHLLALPFASSEVGHYLEAMTSWIALLANFSFQI